MPHTHVSLSFVQLAFRPLLETFSMKNKPQIEIVMQNQKPIYRNWQIRITHKLLLTFVAIASLQFYSNAQSKFTRTTFNATYTSITIGGGATSSTATGDNANQTGIPLGFSFTYGDSSFTSIGLSTNGVMWFDAVAPAVSAGNSTLVTTTSPNQSLAPWWNNLTDDATSDILYQTQGAPGSRKFTIQYTNYPTYIGTAGTYVRMNCQVILYETTNVIEFRYGALNVTGSQALSYGAMIGLEWGTGGSGKYIDAVTGSSIVNNRMLIPSSGWPTYNFRFTPGAPTTIAAGTYNVGVGKTYNSLTQAVADVNHRGISGAVTLNLTDAQYDTTAANGNNIFPIFVATPNADSINKLTITKSGNAATLAFRGTSVVSNGSGTGVNTSVFDENNEPIICVLSSYNTLSNLNLITHGPTNTQYADNGLAVCELFGNKGSHYNLFDKISVDLNRTNSNSVGIYSYSTTAPGGVAGTNSYNTYRDLSIKDCSRGIALAGVNSATGPADYGNQIITSSCNTWNIIGDPNTPDDIIATGTYGVYIGGQNGFTVRNCKIQNITSTSSVGDADGIWVTNSLGANEVSNNMIHTIRCSSTAVNSLHFVSGLRFRWDNQTMSFKIFNNSISNLLSNYTGSATSTLATIGILFQDNTGTVTTELYNNSVSINGNAYPNASSTCLHISSIGENFQIKNNVFANFTGIQTTPAYHSCFNSSAADRYGNSLSLSDYNVYYLADTAQGYFSRAASNYHKTIAAWQAAMTFNPGTDANSQVTNPNFVNNATDLHPTPASTSLDGTGATPPAYITTELDCKPRTAPHDIGAYWAGCWAEGGTISPNATTLCAQQTYVMSASGYASYPGISYQWQRATVSGGPYSNVTGGSGATTTAYTTGKLTSGSYYYVLKVTCPSGLTDYSTELQINVNALPNSTISAAGPTSFCSGGSVTINAVNANNRSYQWKRSGNDIIGATASSYTATQSGTYKVVVTNTLSGCTKISSTGIIVSILPLPTATVTALGPLSFCAGDSVVLQANAGIGLSYAWKKGSNYLNGANQQNYTAKSAGNFKVEVTDSNGCVKTSDPVTVSIICKEGDKLSDNSLVIFPNPATDKITVDHIIEENYRIEIFNAFGSLITTCENQNSIDVKHFAKGIYLIKVTTQNKVHLQQLIKD